MVSEWFWWLLDQLVQWWWWLADHVVLWWSLLPAVVRRAIIGALGMLLTIGFVFFLAEKIKPKPKPGTPHTRRSTWEYAADVLGETFEVLLLVVCHALIVVTIVLCANAVEHIHHDDKGNHESPTFGRQAIDFGIDIAEGFLGPGLLLIGTASALWAFVQRRRE